MQLKTSRLSPVLSKLKTWLSSKPRLDSTIDLKSCRSSTLTPLGTNDDEEETDGTGNNISNIDFRRMIQDPLKMKTKRNLLGMEEKRSDKPSWVLDPSWTIQVRGRGKHAKMKTNGEESQSEISSTKEAKTRRTSTCGILGGGKEIWKSWREVVSQRHEMQNGVWMGERDCGV